jgi:hypothetical protein
MRSASPTVTARARAGARAERLGELVELPLQNLVELVHREFDAVVTPRFSEKLWLQTTFSARSPELIENAELRRARRAASRVCS